jgi:L-amino acid N-acyltransferase YncA
MRIRHARPDDADALHQLKLRLDCESSFMMAEPGERPSEPEPLDARLAERNRTVVVAEDAVDGLVGYASADGGRFRRCTHRAEVVIGVRADRSGRGVGRALLEELIAWAPEAGVRRLELTVMVHNDRARQLYASLGFAEEGLRRASLRVDGRDVDEVAMALLVPYAASASGSTPR